MRELLRGASSGFLTIRHRRCSHQLRNSPTILSAGIVGLERLDALDRVATSGKGRFTILPKFTA